METKRKLVQSMTMAVALSFDLKQELIDEFERENWSTDDELHSDKYGKNMRAN